MPIGRGFGLPRRQAGPPAGGRGLGRGRQPSGFGLGPGGDCVCPKCNARAAHQRGIPCYEQRCPKCGSQMTRTN